MTTVENYIRLSGWFGILLNAGAIASQRTDLFVFGQGISAISGFLWVWYLQKKHSPDLYISLGLSILAVVFKSPWLIYASMLVRSVSYQFVFERVVAQRQQEKTI